MSRGAAAPASSRRHSSLVAAGILLSRIMGLVRERAFSHFLGLTFAADAFAAAFRIPNVLQNLLGEGVLSASFIPVYARLLDEGREEEAGRVAGAVAGLLTLVAGLLVLALVLLAGPLTALIAGGYPPETQALAADLLRIVAPGIGVLVLSAWCLGILNSHRRFFLSYVAPVLWNIAQIAVLVGVGVVLLEDVGEPAAAPTAVVADLARALAWGTVLGSLLQLGIQLPAVRGSARELRLSLDTSGPGVRDVIRGFVPVVTGRGVVQLLALVELTLASYLVEGSVAALLKAQLLFLLPISLFGMSVAAAELPALSSASAQERNRVGDRLSEGLERIAFFVVPSVVVYVLLGDLVVGALFQSGAFDAVDVRIVWFTLGGFCVGLVANTSSRLLQSALYGIGDTRTPATLAAVRVALAAALGYLLMVQLDRVSVTGGLALIDGAALPAWAPLPAAIRQTLPAPNLGVMGLSLAAGISAWLEYRLLREAVLLRTGRDVRAGGGRMRSILLAALPAVTVALVMRVVVGDWHPILGAAVAVPVTGGAYLLAAAWIGLDEARALGRQLRRRLPG
jgi:putative peptidoglycan lipid II flippase